MQEDEESNEKEKANVKLKRNGKDAEVPIHPDEYNFVSLLKTHMAKLGVLTRKLLFGQCIH